MNHLNWLFNGNVLIVCEVWCTLGLNNCVRACVLDFFHTTSVLFKQIIMNVFRVVTATCLTSSDISENPCAHIPLTFLLMALVSVTFSREAGSSDIYHLYKCADSLRLPSWLLIIAPQWRAWMFHYGCRGQSGNCFFPHALNEGETLEVGKLNPKQSVLLPIGWKPLN